MKKKVISLYLVAMFVLCCFCSCTDKTLQEVPNQKVQVIAENSQHKTSKRNAKDQGVVATMLATARYGQGSISVAYVLYDNGNVEILGDSWRVDLPFTKEQAKVLMQAKLDGKACNY